MRMNGTDIDDGRKQVHTEEVSPGAELCQPGHETQRELQRTVLELRAGGPIAYTIGNGRYQFLSDGVSVRLSGETAAPRPP